MWNASDREHRPKEECIRVVVRIRPLTSEEREQGRTSVVSVDEDRGTIALSNPSGNSSSCQPKEFDFDQVYGSESGQEVIYDRTAAGIVDSVCEGYNGTIFVYGQTGSGKTYTIQGDQAELRGIIPRSCRHILGKIKAEIFAGKQFLVRVGFLEIYNEKVHDLLAKNSSKPLRIKESPTLGNFVENQCVEIVGSVEEMENLLRLGNRKRRTAATLMNEQSSRSHCVFTIIVECRDVSPNTQNGQVKVGKLNLVDLAGSERLKKSGSTQERLQETRKINLSLANLGMVINALVDNGNRHIPYRDSKLTWLLKDSLGGNTKTVMIANCGPTDYNYHETMSTLRYADRAKSVNNKPIINRDLGNALLPKFQEEVLILKQKLMMTNDLGTFKHLSDKADDIDRAENRIGAKVLTEDQLERIKTDMLQRSKAEQDRIKVEAQKQIDTMTQQKALSDRQRAKLQVQLEKEANEKLKAKQAYDELEMKINSMEQKLIIGGQLRDKAAKQEEDLRNAKLELEERRVTERFLARKLKENEDTTMLKNEMYSSLQEETEAKTKKLRKLWSRYQAAKTEITDLQEAFQREREDFLLTIRDTNRELKLKQLIIDSFIPPDYVTNIEEQVQWNSDSEEWVINQMDLVGNQIRLRRPRANTSLRLQVPRDSDTSNQVLHGLSPCLEHHERTTKDIEQSSFLQRVQAALDEALKEEELDLDFTANPPEKLPSPYITYESRKSTTRDRQLSPDRLEVLSMQR